ncbi:MAG: hypothetical protein JNK12_00605 [Acidimicrobiales bacterium]|nr:hypothetical protein [Acidimicrobiales bacterium]
MNTITNSEQAGRVAAQAWLAGALRWERVLEDLREADQSAEDTAQTPPAAAPLRHPEAA